MHDERRPPHILVLDDTPDVLSVFRAVLEEAGFRVTTGEKLYESVDDLVVIGPELLVLDFMWSGDRTGWDYLNALRTDRRTRFLPVILCTTPGPQIDDLRRRFPDMDVTLVAKPFDPQVLIDAIWQRLDAPFA